MKYPIILSLALLFGCARQEMVDVKPDPQPSPEKLILKFLESVSNENQEAFLQCFDHATHDLARLFEDIVKVKNAKERFRKKFVETYGEETWLQFDSPRMSFHTQLISDIDQSEIASLLDKEETENEFNFTTSFFELKIREFEFGWLIDTDLFGGDSFSFKNNRELASIFSNVFNDHYQLIGDESVTIFYINRMMARELFAKVFGMGLPEPPKDVDWYDLKAGETVVGEFVLEARESRGFTLDTVGPLRVGFRTDVPQKEDGSIWLNLENGFGGVGGRNVSTVFKSPDNEHLNFTITNNYDVHARIMVFRATE